MAGFANDVVFANNGDFSIAGSAKGSLANGLLTNGQMWIGTTSVNAGGTHINVGTLTSPDSSITIGYSSPNVTLTASQSFDYYSLTPYIVGPDIHSEFTTIGAALAASVADGVTYQTPANIYVKSKFDGYIENITLVDGQNLIAIGANETYAGNIQVTLQGNITMSTGGVATVTGFGIQTTGDYCVTVSGANNTYLNLHNCTLSPQNHSAINVASSVVSSITLTNCVCYIAPSSSLFVKSGAQSQLVFNYCNITDPFNNSTSSTISAGSLIANYSAFSGTITSSGTGAISASNCSIDNSASNLNCLTIGGSGACVLKNCQFLSGSASAISISTTMTGTFLDVNSSNTNTITGSGAFTYGFIAFSGSSSGHNVTTETPLPTLI